MNGAGSRVVMTDEAHQVVRQKSDAQIVRENAEMSKLLEHGRKKVNQEEKDKDEALKEATQANDDEALKALLAKKKAKEPEQTPVKVIEMQDNVSLNFGVVGAGQAGGRLAEVFYKLGYDCCAVNTAKQDLEFLDLPTANKFFLDYSLGGAGKDLEVGRAALEEHYKDVQDFVSDKIGDSDVIVIAASGGGGSGSGAAPILVEMVQELDLPVVVIFVIPGSYDDSLAKFNATQTLKKLSNQSKSGLVSSLILVDNAKIESTYPDVSQAQFWKIANESVVKGLHRFNEVSARPTEYEALDHMDFVQTILHSGNCMILGSHKVKREEYEADETALVESVMDNLDQSLLAEGFDLTKAQTVGIVVSARQEVLEAIPYRSISYIFKYMSSEYDAPRAYKGVYALPSDNDDIEIHFVFSGLSLPQSRVDSLREEADKHTKTLESKKRASNDGMDVDFGDDKSSPGDEMLRKIKRKKGAMSKLINKSRQNNRRRR